MRSYCFSLFAAMIVTPCAALADSSSPKLAAYYDRQMAIVAGKVYAWKGQEPLVKLATEARQVGVGRDRYYALLKSKDLVGFTRASPRPTVLMRGVVRFSAGQRGVLAITDDQALWWLSGATRNHIAGDVAMAAVGDGANYYISSSGGLFVKGLAHRGQYGNGRLKTTKRFVQTASRAAYVTAHTGHAIMLLFNGNVMGTGGNIFGPVGKHGLGDKADRWSLITSGAKAIATGSSHSLAILEDDTLVAWGRGYDTEPVPVLREVAAVAAGSRTTIALKHDGTLWQWDRGRNPRQVRLPD